MNTYGGGVRGKFKFAAGPDCMLALDANADVWVYRQPGYTGGVGAPPPPPPSITVTVSPTGASLLTDSTQVFSATVAGSSNQTVSWSVNGIAGGNSTVGTVSAAGLYVAPAAVPNPAAVTVRATAAANGTSYGEASVTISAAAGISDRLLARVGATCEAFDSIATQFKPQPGIVRIVYPYP